MSNDISKPYTIVEIRIAANGQPYDTYHLVYRNRWLPVTRTEHALLQGLLGEGINYERMYEERKAAQARKQGNGERAISGTSGKVLLSCLREKIANTFPDLVIPKGRQGSLAHLRLMTKAELKETRHRIANPKNGAYVDFDEFGLSHLFINGIEISPKSHLRKSIDRSHLALASILLVGRLGAVFGRQPVHIKHGDPLFLEAWRKLTGRDGISPGMLMVHISRLRRAFKPAGLSITSARPGHSHDARIRRLIPFKPAQPAKEEAPLQAFAAG